MRATWLRRPIVVLGLLGAFVVAYGWNAKLLAPQARQRAEVAGELAAAKSQEHALRSSLAELRRLAIEGRAPRNELDRLSRLVPVDPDLAGFIRTMNKAADTAQVEWSSLVPGPPTSSADGGLSTIGLSFKVEGTFFQLLDYLKQIENLERLVVIDSIDLAGAAATEGTPKLSLSLGARTFAASPGTGTVSPVPSVPPPVPGPTRGT